jgi:hypothetical protein
MAVTQLQARTALADLLGTTVNSSWPTSYDDALQWGLERISRIYDFDFGLDTLTASTDSSGLYAFTTNDGVRFDARLDVRIVNTGVDNDYIFTPVAPEDFDTYTTGDYRFYLRTNDDGTQTLVTTEPSASLTIKFSRIAPTLSASVSSTFPSALAIAYAALIYVREMEDKDADTSVEDAKFQQIMQEIIGQEQRNAGPTRARTSQDVHGNYTGQIASDRYGVWG